MFVLEKGLDHVAEKILTYLDADSLRSAELVCKEWHRVISCGMLWKKLIEHMVRTDESWRGLAERRRWYTVIANVYCFQIVMVRVCIYDIFNRTSLLKEAFIGYVLNILL